MLKKITTILSPFNIRISQVFLLMLITSIFEVISIGSLIPLLAFATNENFYESSSFVSYFINNIFFIDKNYFILACFLFLILVLFLRFLFVSITILIKNNFTYSVQKYISKKLLKNYFFKKNNFFFETNIATLINNVDKESHYFVIGVLAPLLIIAIEFISLLFILTFLFYYDPLSTIFIFLIMSVFLLIFISYNKKKFQNLGKQRKKNEDLINKILIESFSGIKDIKLLQAENSFLQKFSEKITYLCKILSKQTKICTTH